MNKFIVEFQDGTSDTFNTKRESVWVLAIEQAKGTHFFFSTHGTRELAEKARLSKTVRMMVAGTPQTPFVHPSKRGNAKIMADAAADDAKYQVSPERWVNAYIVEARRI